MALDLNARLFRPGPPRPVSRLVPIVEKRPVLWPTVSIVFLLCFSVVFPPIATTVMNTALVALVTAIIVMTNQPIDRRILVFGSAFVGIGVIGLAAGIGADRYLYFKDLWYILNPLLVFLVGYILFMAKPDLARGLRAFVIGGLIVAIWQLRAYFIQPEIILLNADSIRKVVGTGFYAPVAALAILVIFFGRWRDALKLPVWIGCFIFVVIGVAVTGVFSRTALLVMMIAFAALFGCFAKREWLRLGAPLMVLIVIGLSLQMFVDIDSDRALKTFVGKLAHGFREIAISDYGGVRDVNVSYRGHETARALEQFAQGNPLQLMFGRGFGALVDLGIYLPIEINEIRELVAVRYITVLHNGYAYLLTKVGITGMALYVFALGYLYRVSRPRSVIWPGDDATRAARLLQASVVTLGITTYIIGGVFNKLDMFPFMLLCGYLVAYLRSLEPDFIKTDTMSPLRGAVAQPNLQGTRT